MDQANPISRKRRYSVIRWICAGLLVSTAVIGYFTYQHYVDPQYIRQLAEDYLERMTRRKVHIASASFSFREGINLRDVFVSNQPIDRQEAEYPLTNSEEVFSCHEISILQNSWALLRGRLEIESFAAMHPTLTLVHDADSGWKSVSDLVRNMISRQTGMGSAPPIELRQARVKILHRTSTGDQEVEDIQLTVRGRRATENPQLFDVVWQDANDPDANGHSQVDLTTGYIRNVRGGLPTMSIRGVMLAVDAGFEGAEALTDLLGIEGRVRARDYNIMTPPLHDGPRSAAIDLRNASISIPISEEERELKADERYLRFHDVDGTVTITASSIQADFDASFRQSPCNVSATITGALMPGITLADVSVLADLSVKDLVLPNRQGTGPERRFIQRWPELVKFFDHYDPHGKIDLNLRAEKAPGEKEAFVVRQALLTARGSDASYWRFPYRGHDMTGSVQFDADGIFVRDLCGIHDAARVCINGWMEAPHRASPARFSISGKNVPIDDELLAALHPGEKRWIEEFGLEGQFDADISLARARSEQETQPAPWETGVELTFDDLRSTYAKVPLPVTHLSGRASVHDHMLEINHARGELETGVVELNGFAELPESELGDLSFRIAIDDVHIDDELLVSLPAEISSRLAPLNANGCVSLTSDLFHDHAHGWRHETVAHLRNMELALDAFPLPITGALADLKVESDRIEVERARGYYNNAELFAKGDIGLGADDKLDMVVEADAISIDQTFRDAAPSSLREAIADWQVDQPIDAAITLNRPDHHLTWNGRAQLTNAIIRHRTIPRPLENVVATISFTNDEVRCRNARAQYAGASINADFNIAQDGLTRHGQISLRAKDVSLDESIREILPPDARRVWDELSPSGQMDLALDELDFHRAVPSQSATWSVRGEAHPHRVKFSGDDATIDGGVVRFDGMVVDRLGGIAINGTLQDSSLQLFSQPLNDTSASGYLVRTAAGEGRAALRDLHGKVHDGTATTQAHLQFDRQQANYGVVTSLQNVELAPWIELWRAGRTASDDQSAGHDRNKDSDVRGVMDAQLQLEGLVNDPFSRSGSGRVEVRNGFIYKLPIFLAILNVLNINIPNDDVLSEAHGQFYVTGNAVRLVDIAVTGESLSLVGSGTVSLTDQSVDLTLVNAGGGRISRVPLLAELWAGASRELVELRVTGPISQPQVRASPFRGITEEFKKLFQKRKPKGSLQAVNP